MARDDGQARVEFFNAKGEKIQAEEFEPTIEDDIQKQLDDIINEFGQSDNDITWQIVVTRASGPNLKGQREPYLFSCDTADLAGVRDRLRDEYGEGTYRIRVRRNGRIHRQFDYSVEAPKIVKDAPSGGIERELLQRIDRMEQRQNDLLQQLVAARSQQQSPYADPIAMLTAVTAAIGNLAGLRPQTPVVDPMQMMDRSLDMALKLSDLRGAGESGETGILDIIRDAVKTPGVVEAILKPQQPNAQAMQRPNLPPQQPIQNPQAATPQPAQAFDLTQAMVYLNSRAAKGAPVELYAEWVYDNLGEELFVTFAKTPDIIEQLQAQFPAMVPYRPWYDRLLAEIRANVEDGTNQQPETAQDANGSDILGRFAGRNGDMGNA